MSRSLRGLGDSGLSPSSSSNPPTQNTSSNINPILRPRQGGQPENVLNTFIPPSIPLQVEYTPATTSQTGANINVGAARHRYGGSAVPLQNRSSVTTLDTSKFANMTAVEMRDRLDQLEEERKKREEDFEKSAEIERERAHRGGNPSFKQKGQGHPRHGKKGPWLGVTGEDHPTYGRKGTWSGITGANHPMYGTTGAWKGITGANHPAYGIKGEDHPASKAYLRNQLPEELRETAEQQGWSREKLQLQVNAYKYEASQTTTGSTSSAQNPPEEPLVIPRQPPSKQDNTGLDF
jgi:hypothetical protein